MDKSTAKNFDFSIINQWGGYNSANDPTNLVENAYTRGSLNVYKKINGNLSVRPGLKRIGEANTAYSPVSSQFVWNTSNGFTYPVWVSDNKLQVSINDLWYTLETTTETRYVFDKWWNATLAKDVLLFVNGNDYIQMWTGGYATVASATASTITKNGTETWQQSNFSPTGGNGIGATTTQFDITNPSGTTFRYTYDGTGTDPNISSTTFPVGMYVLIASVNFNAANNGIFRVTGSGTNYFEVTNASGVVESNKTIGAGGSITKDYQKVLVINGTLYAYTGGETTTTLTGVTPSPAALTADTVVLQAAIVQANKPATGFSNDFIKVINNQAYVGSYTSRLCYISSNIDYTDYTVPTPRLPGSPELLTLDSTLNGIGVRNGKAYISIGSGEWAIINFSDITVGTTLTQQTTVDVKPIAKLATAYAHEFIGNVGDNLVYLAKDQQLRTFGDFNASFVAAYPSLSQEVSTEFMEENFEGGAIKCIGDFTYITAPASGKTYLYQVRQYVNQNNQVGVERLWHAPFVWNATRIDEINGDVVCFSNSNPQVYQVWDTNQWYDDSPSDEPLPYNCTLALAYRTGKRRQGLQEFDKVFSEGYITAGTPLNVTVKYDYLGATNTLTQPVNSTTRPAYTFGLSYGSLGDDSLGDTPLGSETGDTTDDLVKFKVINSFTLTDSFEYQIIYSSESTNARWEILASGTNASTSQVDATYIINKLRL